MKDLRPIRGRAYILDLIAQGEHEEQDFKFAISDARKIARSISAFANNKGGRLLVGVKDNGTIAGVRSEEDIYMIEQAAQMYCDPPQEVEFTAFSTGETGIVIRARVEKADSRPVRAQEPDHTWRAYFRVADENIVAHPLHVRAWLQAQSSQAHAFAASGAEAAIIKALSQKEVLTIDEAMRAAAVSKRTAATAIVNLAALAIIHFCYTPEGVVLKHEAHECGRESKSRTL